MTKIRTTRSRLPTFAPEDLKRLRRVAEARVGVEDPACPPMTEEELAQPATRGRPRRMQGGTIPVTLRLDADLLAWLKARGKGYQTRLNALVRAAMELDRAQG